MANPLKIFGQGQSRLSDDATHIRESKSRSAIHMEPPWWSLFHSTGVDPSYRGSHQAEVNMIFHRNLFSCLAFATTNILFQLFEARFNLPTHSVVFSDLLTGQR